jgi:hypothetical protein
MDSFFYLPHDIKIAFQCTPNPGLLLCREFVNSFFVLVRMSCSKTNQMKQRTLADGKEGAVSSALPSGM